MKITLDRKWISNKPSNDTIKNFTKKIPLTNALYKREFLIKANSGHNSFGLDPNTEFNAFFAQDRNEADELRLHGNVNVFDKFRNVNGKCTHSGLRDIIRNFGK